MWRRSYADRYGYGDRFPFGYGYTHSDKYPDGNADINRFADSKPNAA